MKKIFLLFGFLVGFSYLQAQSDIETRLVLADTVNYPFTSEWQYLSTDIFLFNTSDFDNIINELNFNEIGRKRRSKTHADEKLEYLFVSASLKNAKYFGGSDMVYPLYNFQINRDKDKQYHTYISDNINHIRIIDNLPLYSAGNNIDAEIKVQAITNNNSDLLLNLVGSQLKNISNLTHPTEAVLSLIGEFGNFIESSTKKREYRFSSTIRLYEQHNFDTRLHSVKVFILNTQNSKPVAFNKEPLKNYLDSTSNPRLDRETLQRLLNIKDYPFLVVLNYRSMYQMKQISGDQVTQEAIDERRARLLIDYKNGLISDETYQQERDFLRFLTSFVELKNNIEFYQLNQGSGNLQATRKSLPKVISQYNQLLAIEHEMDQKYAKNAIYTSIFYGEYQEIIAFADLYLDADPNLKRAKDFVKTLKKLEAGGVEKLDSLSSEMTLKQLNLVSEMDSSFIKNSAEGAKAETYIRQIGKQLMGSTFENEINELKNDNDLNKAPVLASQLQRVVTLTNCNECKQAILKALGEFNEKLNKKRLADVLRQKDSLNQVWSDSVLILMEQKLCLEKALALITKNEKIPVAYDMYQFHFEKLNMHLNSLIGKLKVQLDNPDANTLARFNESLKREGELTEFEFDFFRRNKPCYLNCNCEEIKSLEAAVQKVSETISTDSLKNATNKQLQLFRQFDLLVYSGIDKQSTDSLQTRKVIMVEENRRLIDSLTVQVKYLPDQLKIEDFKQISSDIQKIASQIGKNLDNYCVQFPEDCIEKAP